MGSPPASCLQALKASGPLAITIWADSNPSMQFYKAGVYAHPDSPLAGEDHALVLVGWGEEKMVNGTVVPFWIIANSWGNTWWVGGGAAACGGTCAKYWCQCIRPLAARRGEAGYLRLKREPWRTTGMPYWKGIYSASYPSGKMKSTATPRALLDCGGGSTPSGPVIAVNSSTSMMEVSIRVSGLELDSADAAQALLDGMAVALQLQWITNAFRPTVTSIRLLGAKADESSSRRLLEGGDVLVEALAAVSPRKASDAAEYCVTSLPRVEEELRSQGD